MSTPPRKQKAALKEAPPAAHERRAKIEKQKHKARLENSDEEPDGLSKLITYEPNFFGNQAVKKHSHEKPYNWTKGAQHAQMGEPLGDWNELRKKGIGATLAREGSLHKGGSRKRTQKRRANRKRTHKRRA